MKANDRTKTQPFHFYMNFSWILSNVAFFFWNFQNTCYTGSYYKSLLKALTAHDLIARALYMVMYGVFYPVCIQKLLKNLWTDSPNAFIKIFHRKELKSSEMDRFLTYSTFSSETLSITCACSLCKYLIFAIIYLNKIYSV